MSRNLFLLVAAPILLTPRFGAGQAESTGDRWLPPLIPEAREVELAKSAGLPSFTDHTAVYVLRRGGYQVAQAGLNGFSCLVGRDFRGTAWPICFDPEGTETMLPRLLREAELREQGLSREEIDRDTAERFRTGDYRAPRRPGVAYMLSRENVVSNGGEPRWFPPHLMFYAPYITGADIGATAEHAPLSPMVLYEGDPHAYMIAIVPESMPQQPGQ